MPNPGLIIGSNFLTRPARAKLCIKKGKCKLPAAPILKCPPPGVPLAELTSFCDSFDNPVNGLALWQTILSGTGGTAVPIGQRFAQLIGNPGGSVTIAPADASIAINPSLVDFCICFGVANKSAQPGMLVGLGLQFNAFLFIRADFTQSGNYQLVWGGAATSTFDTGVRVDQAFHQFSICRSNGGDVLLKADRRPTQSLAVDANFPNGVVRPVIIAQPPGASQSEVWANRYCLQHN